MSNKLETQLDNYELKGIVSLVAIAEEMSAELMAEINSGSDPEELASWYSMYTQMYIQFDGQ